MEHFTAIQKLLPGCNLIPHPNTASYSALRLATWIYYVNSSTCHANSYIRTLISTPTSSFTMPYPLLAPLALCQIFSVFPYVTLYSLSLFRTFSKPLSLVFVYVYCPSMFSVYTIVFICVSCLSMFSVYTIAFVCVSQSFYVQCLHNCVCMCVLSIYVLCLYYSVCICVLSIYVLCLLETTMEKSFKETAAYKKNNISAFKEIWNPLITFLQIQQLR
ncbi:unnamed protein product [Gadus morhua 'NCC']